MRVKNFVLVMVVVSSLAREHAFCQPLSTASNDTSSIDYFIRDSFIYLLAGAATSKGMKITFNIFRDRPLDFGSVIDQREAVGAVTLITSLAAPWADHHFNPEKPRLPQDYANKLSSGFASLASNFLQRSNALDAMILSITTYPLIKEPLNGITRYSEPPDSKSGTQLAERMGQFIKLYMLCTGVFMGYAPMNFYLYFNPDQTEQFIGGRKGILVLLLMGNAISDGVGDKDAYEQEPTKVYVSALARNAFASAIVLILDGIPLLIFSAANKDPLLKFVGLVTIAATHIAGSVIFVKWNAVEFAGQIQDLNDNLAFSENIFWTGTVGGAITGAFVGKVMTQTQAGIGAGAVLGASVGTLIIARVTDTCDNESARALDTAIATSSAEISAIIIAAIIGSEMARRLPRPHPDSGNLVKLAYTGGRLMIIPWVTSLAKYTIDNVPLHETMGTFNFVFTSLFKKVNTLLFSGWMNSGNQ